MASMTYNAATRQYAIRWRSDGKAHIKRIPAGGTGKADALEFLAALERRLAATKPIKNRFVMSWGEIVERWHSTRTPGAYRDKAKTYLLALGWTTLADATPDAIERLKPLYQRYVKSVLGYARSTMRLAVDLDALAVRPPKVKRRAKRPLLPDDQIQALVNRCAETGPSNAAIAHLLSVYGHRAESIVHLTTSAWIPDPTGQGAGELVLQVKGGDIVRHPILPATAALLLPLVKSAEADPGRPHFPDHTNTLAPCLFLRHNDGKPWLNGQRWAAWFRCSVGKGIGYYDAFKRAAITKLLDHVDATTVASITGHRTISLLLNTYSRSNADRQRAAIESLATMCAKRVQ
jgi:hypothetical protein